MHYYTSQHIRSIEAKADSQSELMLMAGRTLWEVVSQEFPTARSFLILLGKGNNAGDALSMLSHIDSHHYQVHCAEFLDHMDRSMIPMMNQKVLDLNWIDSPLDASLGMYDLVIDGGVGIGSNRQLVGKSVIWVNKINQSEVPVLSIDIPSGLCPNTGVPLDVALIADVTVTFIAKKLGSILGLGLDYVGKQLVKDLNVDLTDECPDLLEVNKSNLPWKNLIKPPVSHKGQSGKVLIVAGDQGYLGAALLAGESALKSGAGYVKIFSHHDHLQAIPTYCPDLVAVSDQTSKIADLVAWADVIIIGPGLGQSIWSKNSYREVIQTVTSKPIIIDAGALVEFKFLRPKTLDQVVITPHPGEAGMLLDKTTSEVQGFRLESIEELYEEFMCHCVLKGSGTLIRNHSNLRVLPWGNSAMAKAGMGDVLTGMMASMIARIGDVSMGIDLALSLQYHVGDDLARKLSFGLTSGEFIKNIPRYLNEVTKPYER